MRLILTSKSDETNQLSQAANVLGWGVLDLERHGVLPTSIKYYGDCAIYGDRFHCKNVAFQLNKKLLQNPLDWICTLPQEYSKRKVEMKRLSDLREETGPKFMKAAEHQIFDAKMFENGNGLPTNDILDETLILVSDEMKFTSECRCFIKNRKVVSICCYAFKGEKNVAKNYPTNNADVIKFVNGMLADPKVECAPAAVIDVGRFKKDEYAIIGTKPAWAADIYGCELIGTLEALKASCVPLIGQ